VSDDGEPPDQHTLGEWLRRASPNLREPLLSETAAPSPPVASQDPWPRTIRSACHALVASHRVVHSIDVLGRPIKDDDPGNLLRLTELAQQTASEYGIEVRVSQIGQRPVLHLMTSPLD
jgi:hypothetical protein